MNRLRLISALVIIGIALVLPGTLCPLPQSFQAKADPVMDLPYMGQFEGERTDGGYYTIIDEEQRILDKTVRHIHPGDEYIAANNRHYRVERVEGDTAYATLLAENALADVELPPFPAVLPVQGDDKKNNVIGIYHTHSAESYVPTDGTESIPGNGGIYKIGEEIAAKLENKGVEVAYDKSPHDPHDADAYRRSRRTATEIMKQMPAALIDVHRDGVPDPDFYYTNVAGEEVTKVRLVVGRQNQNMQANLDFAKQIKAHLDEYYPGLIQGIFMAKGNYNQDLSPRSILIEVGTHTNDRNLAEKGAALFADAIPAVLGISTEQPSATAPTSDTDQGDKSSLWVLIIVAIAGGGLFLLISTGSFSGAMDKLKQFSSKEWSNFMGNPQTAGHKTREKENDERKTE